MTVPATNRFPFPAFPAGWFAVGFSTEFARGQVVRRTFMGNDVVVFRTESGRPVVMGAYCPHMGAHLGFGARVIGERIRCPMHGFEFHTDGTCARTGYDTKPPPTCRAQSWEAREANGAVFAWHDPSGKAPWFELPNVAHDGWTPLRTHLFSDVPSHPQETTENSVDLGHFGAVHGYQNVRITEPLSLDGPRLSIGYRFERRPVFRGAPQVTADMRIDVHGLGHSFVDVDVPGYRLKWRNVVFATPTHDGRVDLRIGVRLRVPLSGTRALPSWLLDRLLGRIAIRAYVGDVSQDYDIWAHKRYVHPPALAEGDGPIGKYRKWARQFYPDAAGVRGELAVPTPV